MYMLHNVTWLKYMIHICVPSMYEIAAPYIFFVTLLKHFVCVCVGVYYLALEPSSGSKSSLQSPLDPLENRWSKYLNTLSNLINTHSNTYTQLLKNRSFMKSNWRRYVDGGGAGGPIKHYLYITQLKVIFILWYVNVKIDFSFLLFHERNAPSLFYHCIWEKPWALTFLNIPLKLQSFAKCCWKLAIL